jgi:hypothetical protein
MRRFIAQVEEFKTLEKLNSFLYNISSDDTIRIITHSTGYTLIYKKEVY